MFKSGVTHMGLGLRNRGISGNIAPHVLAVRIFPQAASSPTDRPLLFRRIHLSQQISCVFRLSVPSGCFAVLVAHCRVCTTV